MERIFRLKAPLACLNESDLGMVCIPEFGDDYVTPCATDALGSGPATSACLQEDPPGLSSDCADCFGNVTQCIASNCLGAGCASDPDSEACLACRDEFGCDSAFDECAGDLSSACVQ